MSTTLREGKSLAIAKVFSMLLAGLSVIVLARYLGPEKRGVYAAILIVPQMLISLFEGGVKQVSIHELRSGVSFQSVFSKVFFLFLMNSVLASVLCYFILIATDAVGDHFVALTAVFLVVATMGLSYTQGLLIGSERMGRFNGTVWIQKLFLLIGLIVFFNLMGAEVEVALYVAIGSVAVTLFYAFRPLNASFSFVFENIKGILSFAFLGFKFAFALFVISANYRVGTLMLSYMADNKSVGNFALSSQLIDMIWQVPAALSVVIMARSAERGSYSKEWALFVVGVGKALFLLSFLMVMLAVAAVWLCGDLIFGVGYDNVWLILIIMMPGICAMVFFKIINSDLAGKGRPMVSVAVMLPLVLLNVLLNLYFIPRYQDVGAAISSSFTYILCGFIYLKVYSDFSGVHIWSLLSLRREIHWIKSKVRMRG